MLDRPPCILAAKDVAIVAWLWAINDTRPLRLLNARAVNAARPRSQRVRPLAMPPHPPELPLGIGHPAMLAAVVRVLANSLSEATCDDPLILRLAETARMLSSRREY